MYDQAKVLFNEALLIFERLDYSKGVAIFHNLGMIEADCKSYDMARELYKKSFDLDKLRNDEMGMYASYNQL